MSDVSELEAVLETPIDGPLRYALNLADHMTPTPAAAREALCILRAALADSLGIDVPTLMALASTSETGCFADVTQE
ncbi:MULTISPECIES: hypothetical protein [Xanthomonas]|uniref:hypothetical protein n=1 Tax=Xanthomonas TaxID=338 RepID=UPI001C45F6CD|nr:MULTISPECIES: hypothetical protein [Xanthomonas]MBV6855872.1 hypothetical protein [Xanthomonas campestris pv. mirabilis]MBV6867924.1 hypothetical protein [Xanthomonas campestris pv. coriandri]MCE4330843.1 hypothetical protein [Xanthomonas campestris pv. coriandri]MEA9776958.1 hypothetical protein [Xanthomonas campestris pv. raphani]